MDKYEDQNPMDGQNPLADMFGKLCGGRDIPEDPAIQAVLNDQRLLKLADYDITHGYTKTKPLAPEDVQAKFSELKMLVLHKESTLAELETMIYNKWGIQENPRKLSPEAERKPIIGFSTMKELAEDS